MAMGFLVCFAISLAGSSVSQDAAKKTANPARSAVLREEEAYRLGVEAYVYGFPAVEMYRLRYNFAFNPVNQNRTPLNRFRHRRELIDHTYTAVVSPNSDTLYSAAWLDLAREPMVFKVPESAGRYYVFQFLDFYTNNFVCIGTRTGGPKTGTFAIVGPNWKGSLEGLQRIDAPTNAVLMIGRMLVDQKHDLADVHHFQDQCILTSLETWRQNGHAAVRVERTWPSFDPSKPLRFFEFLNIALTENPPPDRDSALLGRFVPIGIGPDRRFEIDKLDPATRKGLLRAIESGKQLVAAQPAAGTYVRGWYLPAKQIGEFGHDYLFRAQVAARWIFALVPQEAVYVIGEKDDQGQALVGSNHYRLRIEKGQLPPTNAFWSITMYRMPDRLLASNPIKRYSISDRTPGLQFGSDGSLEIHIQHDAPDKSKLSNWLPSPSGEFNLILRAYLPPKEIGEGTWKVPALKRVG
jgi:hypothetical protein